MAQELCIAVVELQRAVGTRRPVRRSVELGDASVAGTVPGPAPAEVDVVLESVLEGVMVTGAVRAPWRGECRRCLEPVSGTLLVEVHELYESDHVAGETYPIEADHIDLEPMVRDAVLLTLPLTPLCDDGCRGPDPDRFPALAPDEGREAGADSGDDHRGDPRWAVLSELRFED